MKISLAAKRKYITRWVRLLYDKEAESKNGERKLLDYAEAKCLVEIPVIRLPEAAQRRHADIEIENENHPTG